MSEVIDMSGIKFGERNPISTNLGNLVSSRQLGYIFALCRDLEIDSDVASKERFGCNVRELSTSGASDLIDHLLEVLKKERESFASIVKASIREDISK